MEQVSRNPRLANSGPSLHFKFQQDCPDCYNRIVGAPVIPPCPKHQLPPELAPSPTPGAIEAGSATDSRAHVVSGQPASPHYFFSDIYGRSLSAPEQAELLLEQFAKRAMEEESAAYKRYKQFTDAAEGVFDARCA